MENQIIYNLKKTNNNNNNNSNNNNNYNKNNKGHNSSIKESPNSSIEYNNNNNYSKNILLNHSIINIQNIPSTSTIQNTPSKDINLNTETSNKQRYHYFIGNIFRNDNQIKLLKRIQSKLRKKYLLRKFHWNNYFCTNLIYLGYLDQTTAHKYMDNIIKKLLTAISNKFSTLICNYISYKINYDKSFYKVSLEISDNDNYLKNIIIPYLEENGIKPIYEKKTFNHNPSIDLIYYKHSDYFKEKKHEIRLQIPTEEFIIDHISLIKGSPVSIRSGTPSSHDQMHLEEILKYKFPLKEV
jgi:hypothetical protein